MQDAAIRTVKDLRMSPDAPAVFEVRYCPDGLGNLGRVVCRRGSLRQARKAAELEARRRGELALLYEVIRVVSH